MTNHLSRRRQLIALAIFACIATMSRAQNAAPSQLKFEVASVRETRGVTTTYSNFPLNPGPQYNTEGGLLTARNMPLLQYIVFAYTKNMYQIQAIRPQLPEWARTARFDIVARVDGNPTKDDMRAMMRSLLEERFNIKVHNETREVPVFSLVQSKPGKLGGQLKVHSADEAPCAKEPPLYNRNPGQENTPTATVAGGLPAYCGTVVMMPGGPAGTFRIGGRAVTMQDIALAIGGTGNLERPVLDRTGLTGTFDMILEFAPENPDPSRAGEGLDSAPPLSTAMKEQLGLKLESGKGPVEVVVLDRVEKPGEN